MLWFRIRGFSKRDLEKLIKLEEAIKNIAFKKIIGTNPDDITVDFLTDIIDRSGRSIKVEICIDEEKEKISKVGQPLADKVKEVIILHFPNTQRIKVFINHLDVKNGFSEYAQK